MILTFSIFYNLSIISFHYCNAWIGGSEINTNNTVIKRIIMSIKAQFMKQIEIIFTYEEKFLYACMNILVFYFFKSVLNIECVFCVNQL